MRIISTGEDKRDAYNLEKALTLRMSVPNGVACYLKCNKYQIQRQEKSVAREARHGKTWKFGAGEAQQPPKRQFELTATKEKWRKVHIEGKARQEILPRKNGARHFGGENNLKSVFSRQERQVNKKTNVNKQQRTPWNRKQLFAVNVANLK